MTTTETTRLERLLPTYARADLTIVRGDGCRVWDSDGREYLDFGGGIAVVVARPLPSRPTGGRARSARTVVARLEPVPHRAPPSCSRRPLGSLRGCAVLLLQLGRRGDRGGGQVRAQGDRQARRRGARGWVPRADVRRALRDRTPRRRVRRRHAAVRRGRRGAALATPVSRSRPSRRSWPRWRSRSPRPSRSRRGSRASRAVPRARAARESRAPASEPGCDAREQPSPAGGAAAATGADAAAGASARSAPAAPGVMPLTTASCRGSFASSFICCATIRLLGLLRPSRRTAAAARSG